MALTPVPVCMRFVYYANEAISASKNKELNPVALVHKRTIPTERLPLYFIKSVYQ
jgi:hypothetical protein